MSERRVLIVEDELIVAMGIERMLITLGHKVAGIASSGEEAIRKTEITFPDIILMDIMLKGDMNGIEAAKEIKVHFDISIVYLTACSENQIVENAWKTNPSGYIVKPFDENDLQKSIDVALRGYRMKKDIEKDSEKKERNPEKIRNLLATQMGVKNSD